MGKYIPVEPEKWAEMVKAMAEVTRLKAEVERLRKFNDEALAHIAKEERKSRERLDMAQAEVERLRKAGDAMQKRLIFLHDRWDSDEPNIESDAWNAAKEGKQP